MRSGSVSLRRGLDSALGRRASDKISKNRLVNFESALPVSQDVVDLEREEIPWSGGGSSKQGKRA